MARALVALALAVTAMASVRAAAPAAGAAAIAPVAGEEEPDTAREIARMPGYDEAVHGPPPRQLSGYVAVGRRRRRRLFYVLVESQSQRGAGADPLILWLTGGPGCSSMDAYTYENGPFTFSVAPAAAAGGSGGGGGGGGAAGPAGGNASADGVRLAPNPWSWSRAASVLYVDSPCGAGLSFSRGGAARGEYDTDDHRTARDLSEFVRRWYALHPRFLGRPLYVAGESYGGVYVPMLAKRILDDNERLAAAGGGGGAAPAPRVPLEGYVVGNGVTDDQVDGDAQVPFAWGTALLGHTLHERLRAACGGSYWNATRGGACDEALSEMDRAMGAINPYATSDACTFPSGGGGGGGGVGGGGALAAMRAALDRAGDAEAAGLARPPAPRRRAGWPLSGVRPPVGERVRNGAAAAAAAAAAAPGLLGHTVACADRSAALLYYNSDRVREAIHAAPLAVAGRWEPCSDVLRYTRTAGSMVPVHRELAARGLRALVVSGDHDLVVPFTGTRRWVSEMLGLRERVPWRAWHVGRQVGGYAVSYGRDFVFATVKGAGHMVPQTQPEASLRLLQLFLDRDI